MKFIRKIFPLISLLACILAGENVVAQDENQPSPEKRSIWEPYAVGASWMDGYSLFFNGYDHEILLGNAGSGLPLGVYDNWSYFTTYQSKPVFWQTGAWFHLVNHRRNLRLRLILSYSRRVDTLFAQSSIPQNDIINGRFATEKSNHFHLGVSMMKTTKNLLGFLRLYGGGEIELGLSVGSQIDYTEFTYDFKVEQIAAIQDYHVRGKPRFTPYASAIIGMELNFLKYFGVVIEGKSGLGLHLMVNERAVGLSKTLYVLGLNVYPWGFTPP